MRAAPLLAVGGISVGVVAPLARLHRRLVGWAMLIGAGYGQGILGLLLFLSLVPANDFERGVGLPSWGFALTLAGVALLASQARRALTDGR